MPDRKVDAPATSLSNVLDQSAQITEAVEACAVELSSVNSTLNDHLNSTSVHPGVEDALQKSEVVEKNMQDCAEDLSTLNRALEGEVEIRQNLEDELTAIKENEEAARHAAFHDPLTMLPNRTLFNDRLEHGLAQATRHGWLLAVMFIDLDNFKSINDTYGHAAGDELLKVIADRLRRTMRADDTVSRHGGDEFLYLLLEIKDQKDAAVIAQKIIRTIGEPCVVRVNDAKINASVTSSIGIAMFPNDATTADGLVEYADRAMYRAKQQKTGTSFAGSPAAVQNSST